MKSLYRQYFRLCGPNIIAYLWLIPLVLLCSFRSYAQPPTITSFTPTTACQGETVVINGTNFTKVNRVKIGSQDAAKFTVNNDTKITATIANNAATGKVSVYTDQGDYISPQDITIKPAPIPELIDKSSIDIPFTNCNGDITYQLTVQNNSSQVAAGSNFEIDWGDNSAHFTQTDWTAGAQVSHTYNSQGYFKVKFTITPPNGCTKTVTYNFYNGANPIASLSTTTPTTGLCAPAGIDFVIGNWSNNSAGTSYQLIFGDNSPPVTLPHPLNATNTDQIVNHIYTTSSCPNTDFTATLKAINGCFTTTYTLNQIIVRIKPVADFTMLPDPACAGEPVCFTNKTTEGYTGTNCSKATNYTWDFGDGTPPVTVASPPCHIYATAGSYQVTLTAGNNGCGSDTKTKTIVVNPVSPPPIATPATYCQNEQPVPLTASGTNLLWYTTPTGGTGNPVAPTPPTNNAGTLTWYVSQTLTGQCESPRTAVTVTIHPLPVEPTVVSPVALCQNQTAGPLTATGTGLQWYTEPAEGTALPSAPVPSTTVVGSTIYYVSQTINNCEGPRASIEVIVSALPTTPAVTSPVIYCQDQIAAPLTASGSNLLWYLSATGGTGSAVAPVPSTVAAGTTTYYVSQSTGCGESPRSAIAVTVNPKPYGSIAYTPDILCNDLANDNVPAQVVLNGTPGGSFSISPAAGLPMDAAGTVTPAGATPGVYTIAYKIPASGGCADFTTTTTVTINAAPKATISYPAICSSNGPAAVQLTGTTGGTFSSSAGLIIDAATGFITPATSIPGTYTVTYTIAASAPCPGFTTQTDVTITKAPTAAIAYTSDAFCNAANSVAFPNPPAEVTLTGTKGGTYSIMPVTGLPMDAAGTITPAGATPGRYTITYSIPGAGGCSIITTSTTVTISGAPQASIGYPPICSSDNIVSVQLTGSSGGKFTSTAGLTIDAATGSITPASSIPGTYKVTYDIAASTPCPGFIATTDVVITKAPDATITYTPSILCNVVNTVATPNPPVRPSITGETNGVFSIAPLTGLPIGADGTINPSGATAGIYTVSYIVPGTGGCKDYTAQAIITINNTPVASISYPESPFCGSTNTPQQVMLTGNKGGQFSSTAGLTIDARTGAINPSASKPGSYVVTYTIAPSDPCPGFSTNTTVVINESPVISFAVKEQAICSGGTAIFKPTSTVANTTYTWSVKGNLPAGVSGVTSGTAADPNAIISLSFFNTTSVRQTIQIQVIPTNPTQKPCSGAPFELLLNIDPIPPALAGDTTTACMHTGAITLSASPLPGNTVKWYDNNFTQLNSAPVVDTKKPAEYTYYASQVNNFGCESPKSTYIAIIHPTAKIVRSSYVNPSTCGIPSGSIILNVLDLNNDPMPNIPATIHYNKFQSAYTANATTDANGKITIPLTAGTYSDIYVETYGCTSQKIPDVFILKDPGPPAQPIAGYNAPLCTGGTLNLSASSATGGQAGDINYVWVGPAFGNTADTSKNTSVSFPSAGIAYNGLYIVYVMQNNCISTPASFQVAIKNGPTKPIISTKTPLCEGDNLTLQASSSIEGNDVLNYTWKGPGITTPINGPYATVNNIKIQDAGIYTVTVTSTQTTCIAASDTMIQVGGYPVVKFAQDTLTLPTGYILRLATSIVNGNDPNILPITKYAWTPPQDIQCNDAACSLPSVTIKNNACYSVKATNSYGCSGSDTMCVNVFCQNAQVFIPNAFTPRGNIPENTRFTIRGTGIVSVKSLRVFNRWGRLVFERSNFRPNDPQFGWDGLVNGKPADTGVYVYTVEVICENGVPYQFKGNVTLLNN